MPKTKINARPAGPLAAPAEKLRQTAAHARELELLKTQLAIAKKPAQKHAAKCASRIRLTPLQREIEVLPEKINKSHK